MKWMNRWINEEVDESFQLEKGNWGENEDRYPREKKKGIILIFISMILRIESNKNWMNGFPSE